MNAVVQNAERTRKPKLLVHTAYFGMKDGKEVSNSTIQNDVDYADGRIEFSAIGEPTLVVRPNSLNKNTLALRGLAYSIKAGAVADTIEAFFREARERAQNISNGVFNERAGERGANLDRFVKVFCAIPEFCSRLGSNDPDYVRAWVEEKMETLNKKEEQDGSRKPDQDCAGDVWLNAFRKRPEYQEKQNEMFPRQPRTKKTANVDDLFA